MPGLSLREAAQQAGTSKSTILRAIQSGRLSASRTDDGGYAIDPAELFRVYKPKGMAPDLGAIAPQRHADHAVRRDASADATDLRMRNSQLESEISGLKTILDVERKRADELRQDRDRWASQAERFALPAPAAAAPPQRAAGWWRFGR